MDSIRIFISSPSDVEVERQISLQVIQRLSLRFQNSVELKPILWEREPLLASGHFQDALDPVNADIMVCILWSRLGSPLPKKFKGVDGREGLTGSEWEFEFGLKGFSEKGKPDILMYRKTSDIASSLSNEEENQRALKQKKMVDAFFQSHFHNQDESNTFKRAFFPFEKIQDFESQLETHLQHLIERQLKQKSIETKHTITWHTGSPYLGLSAFDTKHQGVYFGRTRAIGELMSQLKSQVNQGHGFVMVVGMSGSGKSSLVNAGLLPLILTPRVVQYVVGHVLLIRTRPSLCNNEVKGDKGNALLGLCHQIILAVPEIEEIGIDAETLYEQIKQSRKSLQATLKNVCKIIATKEKLHTDVQVRLQLVLDQSEEIFTNESITIKQQKTFWQGIKTLTDSGLFWFVGSLRSDFESQGEGTELIELMREKGRYNLQPPNSHEIELIIRQPAQAAGLIFEENDEGLSLAAQLRNDTESQSGSLPLLEFCLDELFSLRQDINQQPTLTFNAYFQELGGLTGSISKRAETVIQDLKNLQGLDVENSLPKIFNELIQVNPDNPDEVATAKTLTNSNFAPDSAVQKTIDALIAARLLTTGQNSLRIAHEALIHKWERIQQWLAMDKEFQSFKARVERDAHVWEQFNKDKSRLISNKEHINEAKKWHSHRENDLSELAKLFINTSISRNKNKLAFYLSSLIILLFVAGVATNRAYQLYSVAQNKKEIINQNIKRTNIKGDLILYATSLGNVALDGQAGSKNGPLAIKLSNAIAQNKDYSFLEIFGLALNNVTMDILNKYSGSHIGTPQISNSLTGSIYPHHRSSQTKYSILIIGNDNYEQLPKLRNAVNDARTLRKTFEDLGHKVSYYENVDSNKYALIMDDFENQNKSKQQFLDGTSAKDTITRGIKVLDRLPPRLVPFNEDSVSIVYFSGHGFSIDGQTYFVPIDMSVEDVVESINHPQSDLQYLNLKRLQLNQHSKTSANIYIFDVSRYSVWLR